MSTLPLLTPAQAADRLGLSVSRVKQFCEEGRIGQRVGRRWIICRDELEQFAKIPRPNGRPRSRNGNGVRG